MMKAIFTCRCCKKKKKPLQTSYVSEINNILTNKRNLIQIDSMKLNYQKALSISSNCNNINDNDNQNNNTCHNNSNNTNSKQLSKSFAFSPSKFRIKHNPSLPSNKNPRTPYGGNNNDKRFLHEFKDKLRCVFCGGKDCKHENYLTNLNDDDDSNDDSNDNGNDNGNHHRHNHDNENAIEGLHSNFITEWVIASQRPSEVLIKQFQLVSKFKEYEIDLIVNLQREGEHPYCGPNAYNLTAAGYSYNPSVFTSDNIKCRLSGWKDMSVPSSMNFMLEIVKDMTHTVTDLKKRVLVHCHAGYGRTGVVIACYLLFNSDKTTETVIAEIRSKRKRCIESNDQQSFCQKFHDFLFQTRMLFDQKENIDVYLKRQEDLLYGNEVVKYGYIPKIMTKTFEKIICLKENDKYPLENVEIYSLIKGIRLEWDEEYENILNMLKLLINKGNWELFDHIENLIIIVELMFDWFEDYVHYVISPERTELIVYNECFIEYSQYSEIIPYANVGSKSKGKGKGKAIGKYRPGIIEELFSLIRKIYHCFEYETLFQFASFCALIAPSNSKGNSNEKSLFDDMIERMSYGLLGFPYHNNHNDHEDAHYVHDSANKSIEALVLGLSDIIKLIYNSILSNEESESQCQMINPLRKSSIILSPPKKQNTTVQKSSKSSQQQLFNKQSIANEPYTPIFQMNTGVAADLKPKPMQKTMPITKQKDSVLYDYLTDHYNNYNKEMLNDTTSANFNPNEIQAKATEDHIIEVIDKTHKDKVIEEKLKPHHCVINCSFQVMSNRMDEDKDKDKVKHKDKNKEKQIDNDVDKDKDKDTDKVLKSPLPIPMPMQTKPKSQQSKKSNLPNIKDSNTPSLLKQPEDKSKKKSSLITFESFRRSLIMNSDSKAISSLASIMKRETENNNRNLSKKNTKDGFKSIIQLTELPEISNDPGLMKELESFKQRQSKREKTLKTRHLKSFIHSKESSARTVNNKDKDKEKKSNNSHQDKCIYKA